jgi:hypothetical protein
MKHPNITVGGNEYEIQVEESGDYLRRFIATPILPYGWYITADVGIWNSVEGQHSGRHGDWGYEVFICADAMVWCDSGTFYHSGYKYIHLDDNRVYGASVEAITDFLITFGVHRWNPQDM